MVERELRTNLTATDTTTPVVEGVTAAVKDLAVTQDQLTQATTEAAEATEKLNLEEIRAQALVDLHAKLVRNMNEAYRESKVAIANMSDAANEGGKKAKVAIEDARLALKELLATMDAIRARGGIIPASMADDMKKFETQVQSFTNAQNKAADGANNFGAAANLARGNAGGLARFLAGEATTAAGTFLGAFAKISLVGIAVSVSIELLVKGFKVLTEGVSEATHRFDDWIRGFNDNDVVVRKSGEAYDDWMKRVDAARAAADKLVFAHQAMDHGLIVQTADAKEATAAWEGMRAAQTGTFENYPEFVKALKDLGVTFKATSGQMKYEAELLGDAFKTVLIKDGEKGALAFADFNKTAITKVIGYFKDAEEALPRSLQVVADAMEQHQKRLDLLSNKHRDAAAKIADTYTKLEETTKKSIEAMIAKRDEDIASVEKQTKKSAEAIEKQEADLKAQYVAGTIDAVAYRKAMDKLIEEGLQNDENAVKEKKRLNEIEKRDEDEKVKEFGIKAAELEGKLKDVGYSYEFAANYSQQLRDKQRDVVAAQEAHLRALIASDGPMKTMNNAVKDGAQFQKDLHKNLNETGKALAANAKGHVANAKAAERHAAAARTIALHK